jgi:hypothetical protein
MKKLFTILTMLVIGISGMWGQYLDRTGWNALASSACDDGSSGQVAAILDGSNTTWWHSNYGGNNQYGTSKGGCPHAFQLDLGSEKTFYGVRIQSRTDALGNGRVKVYNVFVSNEPFTTSTTGFDVNSVTSGKTPVLTGTFNNSAQGALNQAGGDTEMTGRYILFVITDSYNQISTKYAHIAEVNLLATPVPSVSNIYIGATKTNIGENEWKNQGNWVLNDAWNSNGPGCPSSNMWSPIYLKDITSGTVPTLEGWNFRMTADHSTYTIASVGKIQGGQDAYITLKNNSVVTMNFGNGHTFPLKVNLGEGNNNILNFNMSNGYNHLNCAQNECTGQITVNYGSVSKNTNRVFNASASSSQQIKTLILNATLTEPIEKNKVESITLATFSNISVTNKTLNISGADGWTKVANQDALQNPSDAGKYYYENWGDSEVKLYTYEPKTYYVTSEQNLSDISDLDTYSFIYVNNGATLIVDKDLTIASNQKITAETGGSIVINEGFTLDASAQAANRTEHRGLITAASGDGTLKLKGDIELITYSDTYTSDLEVNTNIIYTDEISLVGTERLHDHMVVNTGKSLTVHGDLKVLRSQFTANGTVVANNICLGHPENGQYTGVLNINGGATVQTGQIYFQNKGGNSALNMTGGTLEFISNNDIESAIAKRVDDVTYSVNITGGTIKAAANATIPAGIAMSIGNVTVETVDGMSLAMNNDLTLAGTITNKGTLSLGGALNAETLTVFADGGAGSTYSDGINGFLSGTKKIIDEIGDDVSTTITAEGITVGETVHELAWNGSGSATVSVENSSGKYYINEGGDTEYSTVVAKLSTEGDNIVLNGGILTMDDEYSKPISMARNSTVVVSEGTSLSQGNITGDHTLTINGAGTYNTNYSVSAGLGATLGSNWTGTVARANGVVGGPFNINTMVNGSMSKAQLTHVSGWIQQGFNTTANIVLVNGVEPDDYGFCVNGANSNNSYYFSGDFSGDGDFVYNQNDGGTRTPIYHFSGDLSNWQGKFNLKENGTGTTTVNVTSIGDINAGFKNSSTKANTLKVTFSSDQAQNVNGEFNNSGSGQLVLKLLGTGAKTISANIDVSRLKVVKADGAEITISGTPTISVGQLEAYTDDNNTAKTSLNIKMSEDDITAKLNGNASCSLIDVANGGAVDVTSFTINGAEMVTIGDYAYYINHDESTNDIVLIKHYTRNVTSGNFGSICLPNGASVSDLTDTGIEKVLVVTEVTTDRVVMNEVDEMVAGVPYIFKSNDAAINLTLKGETVAEPNNSTQNYLVGNFEPTGVPNSNSDADYNYYILQSNQFKKVTSETIKSGKNRCYLKVGKEGLSRQATLGIAVDDGGATGIDAINSLMNNDAEIYDLNGRRLNDLRKGINIVNGVKVIVK